MNNKELKIVPPEGYEVDILASTFECIKFKPISIPQKNIITKGNLQGEFNIGGKTAFSMFLTEDEGNGYRGRDVSGHQASLYLFTAWGMWYNEQGEIVSGYFFYKPNE